MQSFSQINKNLDKVKKLIKLKNKNFYHNNLNYFPLIKLLIFSDNLYKDKRSHQLIKNKIFSIIKFIFNLPIFLIDGFLYKNYIKKKLVNSDVVFFSDINFYYDKIKSKKFNAFIDPYFRLIAKNHSSIKLEIAPHWYKKKINKLIEPIYLKILYLDLLRFIIFKMKNYFFFQEEEFYTNLKPLLKKYKINYKSTDLQKKYEKIYFHSKVLEKVLIKIKPKIVFLTCYYNDMSLATILACKKLNIKTVDIQHGGFEPAHLMYKYWQKSEIKKGYELLPNFFWVWKKEHLLDSFFKQNKNHTIIEGGKLVIQKIEKIIKDSQHNLSIQDKYFIKSLKKYERTILFCATSELPKCLIEAIKLSQKNKKWMWMIRLHPRHSNYRILKETLVKEKILLKNVKIEKPSKLNLYLIINNSSHVLIDQSSVGLDASYLKKPVISLTNQKKLFKSWDAMNLCHFTNNPSTIIKLIKNVKKNKCTNPINYNVKNYDIFEKIISN